MKEQRIHALYTCCIAILLSLVFSVPSWGYEKDINALSTAMAEKIAKAGRTTVAVVDFTDLEGNVTQLGRFIAEEFSTSLAGAGKGFKVVDRTHLNSIIKEKKLSATGLIDPKTARKLGQIIGVQALITGTLTPFGDNVRIAVKVLDTATAEIIDAIRGNIAKTQGIEELLGKEITVVKKKEDKSTEIKKSQPAISGSFSDDFNMGPKPDWKPIAGNWTMANGKYTVTDIQGKETYSTFLDGKEWGNIVFTADITPGDITNRWGEGDYIASICPKMISLADRICIGLEGKSNKFRALSWYIVKEGEGGEYFGRKVIETPEGQAAHVKIEVKKGIFTAYINNIQISQIYDTTFSAGSIGLLQWYAWWDNAKIRIAFDNIEIKPLSD